MKKEYVLELFVGDYGSSCFNCDLADYCMGNTKTFEKTNQSIEEIDKLIEKCLYDDFCYIKLRIYERQFRSSRIWSINRPIIYYQFNIIRYSIHISLSNYSVKGKYPSTIVRLQFTSLNYSIMSQV